MSDGMIPVGTGDLPIEVALLDDAKIYTAEFTRAALAQKLDKNDNMYCSIQVCVTEGDYEGTTLTMNYLPLPRLVSADASKRERIQAQNASVAFERFCRAFGIRGKMPVADLVDRADWDEWIQSQYGKVGKVSVKNDTYQGRTRSVLHDFIF